MCIICVSTISIASLIAPTHLTTQAEIQPISIVEKQPAQEFYSTKKSEYKFTNNSCLKSELNKVKGNTVCLKNGKVYRWATKQDSSTSKKQIPKVNTPSAPTAGLLTYSPPTQPSADVELCKIKENNNNRRGMPTQLAAGFPGVTIAQKTGVVKWALIPLDFPDLPGEANFRTRIDEQMKLTSDWFDTVSEGKFKVEWVVQDNWVRLPSPTSQYAIDRSDNLDRVPNGIKLWNDAMRESDKVFNFTGVQTVNFILPKGHSFINETSQGFPWDQAVKDLVTNEGSVSSYSIPGKLFDQPGRQYWSYFAHEFGHAMGIPHIGSSRDPNPFLGLDLMSNQEGESRELSGWLRFVAGWLNNEKVFCQELSNLNSSEVTLVPLSDSGSGIKMIVIPVSQTKAVVVESRRETKFSCVMPSKRNGVLVYTYDATLSHGQDFLKPIGPAGRVIEYSSNCLVVGYPNPILYKGQKVTVEGVTVEVIDSLNFDKVKLSRE